jgi:hypothetical protein
MSDQGFARSAWESFYVIIGSSAGALIGLQFVVIALLAETRRRSTWREIDAFATPTIMHFCAALLIAAILNAPWPSLASVRAALAVCGLAGLVYVAIVIRRTSQQLYYKPVLEDWIWHAILPFIAYAALFAASATLTRYTAGSLFIVAATALLLLFIGIHNAWDTVTYIALNQMEKQGAPADGAPNKEEKTTTASRGR